MPLHEIDERQYQIKQSSDRSFGIVFTVLFALIGIWPLLDATAPRWWAILIAVVLLVIAIFRPPILAPLNRAWTRFGLLLHGVVNPILMALMFYLAVTPIGLLMRLAGKDPLRTRFDDTAVSYWIHRDPPGPPPSSMKNQY